MQASTSQQQSFRREDTRLEREPMPHRESITDRKTRIAGAIWYTIYLGYVRSQPTPHSRCAAAGHQHQLSQGSLCRAEAGDHRDGHLRPRARDPARRAAALGGARRQPHPDPRGDDPARAGRLCPHPPAPRHLCRAQDQARDRRDDHGDGGARKHGGAARRRARCRRGNCRPAPADGRVPAAATTASGSTSIRMRTSPFTRR